MVIDMWCFDWESPSENNLNTNNTNMVAWLDGPNGTFMKSSSRRRHNTNTHVAQSPEKTIEKRNDLIPLLQPKLVVDKSIYVAIFQKIGAYISWTEQREWKLTYNAFRDAGLQEFIKGITHHGVDSRWIITDTSILAGRPLFTLKDIYIFWDTYTLIDTEDNAFEAKIDDFNKHGFSAASLAPTDDLSYTLLNLRESVWNLKKTLKTKVVKLENMIEWLQQKLQVTDFSNPIVKKKLDSIWAPWWWWYKYNQGNYFNDLFPKLHQYINNAKDSASDIQKNRTFNPIELFKIKQVYTQDNYYILGSENGTFFHVKIDDYNKNGASATSFALWKPSISTPSNLVRDFTLEKTATSLNLIKKGTIVSTIVWDQVVVVNKEQWYIIVVNDNLLEYMQIDENAQQIPQNHPIRHPYWEIEKIRIDRNSNFLLIVSKYPTGYVVEWAYENGWKDAETVPVTFHHKLHIVNRVSLEEIESHDCIVDIIEIDNKNDLTCVDSEGKLVSIDTNFDQFPIGFVDGGGIIAQKEIVTIKNAAIAGLENALSNGGIQIDESSLTGKTTKVASIDADKKAIVEKIWEIQVGKYSLKELFEKATTREDIEILQSAVMQIAANPAVATIPNIMQSIEYDIEEKRLQIENNYIASTIEEIREKFETLKNNPDKDSDISYFPSIISLKNELENIKKYRSQLAYIDNDTDNRIKTTSDEIQAEILEYRLKNTQSAKLGIEKNIEKIDDFLESIEYIAQVTQIYNTDLYSQTMELIDFLDEGKAEYQSKIKELISKKIQLLQEKIDEEKKKEEKALQDKVSLIEWHISDLYMIVKNVESDEQLETLKKNNILVQMIQEQSQTLPVSEWEKLLLSLENIFHEQKQSIRLRKSNERWITLALDEYGIDMSLYYSQREQSQIWFKILGHKTKEGMLRLEIQYDNGTLFNLDTYLTDPVKYASGMLFDDIESELSQKDFVSMQRNLSNWLSKWKQELQKTRELFSEASTQEEKQKLAKKIQELRNYYKVARHTEWFALHLANTLNLNPRSKLELPNTRFIVLDEEKDILEKMSAGFAIQRQEQKGIDILEGPPGLGKTEICRFFAAITNREIIRVQCSKMDPSELFFAPQLKAGETTRQPAEWIQYLQKPGTLILFDEIDKLNPQSFERLHSLFDGARAVYDPQIWWVKAHNDCIFAGTRNSYEKMSNPIVSRSVIIQITAPSPENESFKVSKYTGTDFFDKLSFSEYNDMKRTANEPWVVETINQIEQLVKIFNGLRQEQVNDDEKFEYEISYRDAEQIFLRYKKLENPEFKKVVLDILIPKARAIVLDNDDKDIQEAIVNKIIAQHIQ